MKLLLAIFGLIGFVQASFAADFSIPNTIEFGLTTGFVTGLGSVTFTPSSAGKIHVYFDNVNSCKFSESGAVKSCTEMGPGDAHTNFDTTLEVAAGNNRFGTVVYKIVGRDDLRLSITRKYQGGSTAKLLKVDQGGSIVAVYPLAPVY